MYQGVRHDIFKLAHFVASECEAGVAVLAFDPDARAAVQFIRQSRQLFDGCGVIEEKLDTWDVVEWRR